MRNDTIQTIDTGELATITGGNTPPACTPEQAAQIRAEGDRAATSGGILGGGMGGIGAGLISGFLARRRAQNAAQERLGCTLQ